jgi:hypothetical protein
MKTNRYIPALLTCLLASLALSADAADRVHAGQWDTTMTVNGKTRTLSACIPQGEADAMNGDANSIRAAVEKSTAATGCKVTDVKVNGGQVIVASICAGKEGLGTTVYHGDSAETETANGAKFLARRVGACK